MKSAATVAAEAAPWTECKSSSVVAFMSVEAPTVAPVASAVITWTPAAASIVPVIPRSSANENAAGKPTRAVVAVRRTSVGRIVIVSVRAYRRSRIVSRAESHADSHADSDLRLRVGEWHHQNRQQNNMLHIS